MKKEAPVKQKQPTNFELVGNLMKVMGQPVLTTPKLAEPARQRLRLLLILEEFREVVQEMGGDDPNNAHLHRIVELMKNAKWQAENAPEYEFKKCDLAAFAKELGDLLVVTYGTGHENGLDLDKVMVEIDRSNMSKLDDNGKPIYNEHGKFMKGPNYRPADMTTALGIKQEDAA